MPRNRELEAARLVDEYLARRKQGRAVDLETYLDQCPASLRDEVRLAVEGAEFFASHHEPLIAVSPRLKAAIAFAKESAERRHRLAEMARLSVELAPLQKRMHADDLQGVLGHIVGAGVGGPKVGGASPAAYYRNLQADAPPGPLPSETKPLLHMAEAERLARHFLESSRVAYPPVDPYEVAKANGILVVEREIDGCDGCMLVEGLAAVIVVNLSIAAVERRRFTVAHEMGHYAVHQGTVRFRSESLSEMEGESPVGAEAEANAFAAELLMPAALVEEFARQVPSFAVAEAMQERFATSFTAAALRMVKRSHYACALVMVRGGAVAWVARSSEWRRFWVPVGDAPGAGTLASTLLERKALLRSRDEIPADWWFPDDDRAEDVRITEEARSVFAGDVLSLLYDPFA
jgi:Zn-dependent peptidase ImmA (M78 family)